MRDDDLIDLMKTPKSPESSGRDEDLIDLMKTSKSSESDSGESDSDSNQRDSFSAFIIGVGACFVPIGIAVFGLKDLPGGVQIASVVGYTLMIPYILSNRFLNYVPWSLLTRFRKKFLLVHCLALAAISSISTLAFAARPHLPDWFLTSGRRPALFYYCLGGILLALAFWESSWISGHKSERASDKDEAGPRLPWLT
jgi:hypothetical protein